MAHFVGLPRGGDLAAQLVLGFAALGDGEVGAVALREELADAGVFLEERAAHHFGRMRGEHELDPQRGDALEELLPSEALLEQPGHDFVERAGLRPRLGVALVVAPAAHAVVLLGDVGEAEKVRKRARDRQGLRGGKGGQQLGEPVKVLRVAGAATFSKRPHALDQFEELGPGLRAQRLPEQVAQQVNVIAKGLVSGVGHGLECTFSPP